MSERIFDNEAEAAALEDRIEKALDDFTPFFEMLERPSGALQVGFRELWKNRFDTGVRHSDETIKARAKRTGYYQNEPGPLATRSFPVFYWTGSELKSLTFFTVINDGREAIIDPDQNYTGPLAGVVPNPFSDIVGKMAEEQGLDLFAASEVRDRIERDLSAYLFKVLGS